MHCHSNDRHLAIRDGHQNQQPSLAKNKTCSKAKRARVGKPKVKTGCFTCRARHVKCDESRPHCQRCLKFGVICDGFPSQPEGAVAPATRRREYRTLQPKSLLLIPRSGFAGIQSAVAFTSERELRYFRIFCDETASQIAGPFKSSLWGTLVPQASEIEPFVRHAMIAIAAVTKISKDVRRSRVFGQGNEKNLDLDLDHQYALMQYGKALKGMRAAMVRDRDGNRIALIACLLAFCFETLQGRQAPACKIASTGLKLFHQNNHQRDISLWGISKSSDLEDGLVNSLASLDIQLVFFLDDRPLALHQHIVNEANEVLKLMPPQFSTLDEARFFSQIMMRRNFHFKAKAQSLGRAAELVGKKECLAWTETADFGSGEVPFSKVKDPLPEIQTEAQAYIMDIIRWNNASATLFRSIARTDRNLTIIASLLQIQSKMNTIYLAGMTFTDETSFDAFLPDFRSIVNLASYIHPFLIESSQDSGLYHFDLGMLPALYLVGTRCRDKTVRGKAIDLMRSPYREGIWDSGAIASLSEWARSVEVKNNGGNEDYIPESKRIFLTGANVDLFNRRAKIYSTQRTGPGDDDLVFMEGLVTW